VRRRPRVKGSIREAQKLERRENASLSAIQFGIDKTTRKTSKAGSVASKKKRVPTNNLEGKFRKMISERKSADPSKRTKFQEREGLTSPHSQESGPCTWKRDSYNRARG